MHSPKSTLRLTSRHSNSATWPYLVMVCLIMPSIYWAAKDSTVWPWDQAWYGEVSVDLWYTLLNEPNSWMSLMVHAFGTKAPGIAWIGQFFVPVGQLFHSIEFSFLLFIILTQLATLILTYHIGKELFPGETLFALTASLFVASTPLFVGLSHQYVTEPLQLLAVTYFYWIAAKAPKLDFWNILIHLMFAASLSMIAKASSPLYCILPGLFAVFYALKSLRSAPSEAIDFPVSRIPLILVGTIFLSASVIWYVVNFDHVRRFIKIASSSKVALDYGNKVILSNKLLYWLAAFKLNFFVPKVSLLFGIILLLAIILTSIQVLTRKKPARLQPFSLIILAAGFQIAIVFVVLSLNINEENRYLFPILPSLFILLFGCIHHVKNTFFRISLILVVILQFCSSQGQALGTYKIDYSSISPWLKTFRQNKQTMIEVERLVQLTATEKTMNRLNICGVEYPWLNANSLSFYAAKARLKTHFRCYYTSLGYAETDMERAWQRLKSLKIPYFISIKEEKQPKPPNFVNKVSLPILQRIRQDKNFVPDPAESILGVIVFRNTQEAT